MAQIVELADEQLQVRQALPAEVNNVLTALWSGVAALGLALAALLPMIVYDWSTSGLLEWLNGWGDMLGWLGAGVIVLLVAVLAGLASLSSVKAQPRGLKLTKIVAVLVLVVGLLLNLAVLVMIIQGQFKLGPTPILAGSLLTVLGLFPVFLGGLTWSLTTVEAVQQFFYPPEEAPAEVPVEVAEEEEVAPVSEEDLERSLGELPTGTSAAPPVSVPGEVIRAELDESLLVRAELDTETGEIIRAELDEQRILRAELDEERLVRAEPATTTLTGITGPTSDILEAPATPSAVIPAEIDIERIGDTSSRVLERGEVSESPSAVLLTSLQSSPSPSGIISELVGTPTPSPIPSSEPAPVGEAAKPPEDVAPAVAETGAVSQEPVSEAVEQSAEPLPEEAAPSPEVTAPTPAEAEEIFSAPQQEVPGSETSAVDLEKLAEFDFLPAPQESQEPETPVYLPTSEPEVLAEQPLSAEQPGEPGGEMPSESPGETLESISGSEVPDSGQAAGEFTVSESPAPSEESASLQDVPLFPELADDLPPLMAEQQQETSTSEPSGNPPSDELFRGIEESDR
jgi:hypothetical protein